MKETQVKIKSDGILDFTGKVTGFQPTKRNITYLVVALAVILIFTLFGTSMGLDSMQSSFMLGLIIGTVVLWVSNMFDMAFCLLVFAVVSMLTKLLGFADLQAALGGSQYLMMMGMFVVAQGAEQTPIAKRVAYFFLYKFGKNQALMLLAIFISSAILSVFCSNLASTVVMAAICIGIVRELEVIDPNSRHTMGKSIMLMIPMGAMLGGLSLISSSPGMNVLGVTTLETASGGLILEYNQWAAIGIPSAILLAIPTWLIYKIRFKVPSSGVTMDAKYFKDQLDELGGVTGAEIRWTIVVLGMVGAMISGVPTGVASLTAATMAMSPFIGCIDAKRAFKNLPFSLFLMLALNSIIAIGFSKYGIAEWITTFIVPILDGMTPFWLMLVCGLILSVLNSIFANATFGIISICITVFTPIVMSLGMDPRIILVPAIFMGACTNVLGVQLNMYLTYEYGFWDMKDPIIPGALTNLLWLVVITVVAYFMGPIIGLSYYM